MTCGLQLSSIHINECKPKGIVMMLLILIIMHCTRVRSVLNSEDQTIDQDGFCQYGDLQRYVVNDELLMSNLTEAFFNTGAAEAKFLKITYKFELSTCNDTHQNDSASEINLSEIEYIWSQSSLYLLGPQALFWFTLSAVNIPESSVTIELPCLCNSNYRDLLSRLTYMVS